MSVDYSDSHWVALKAHMMAVTMAALLGYTTVDHLALLRACMMAELMAELMADS